MTFRPTYAGEGSFRSGIDVADGTGEPFLTQVVKKRRNVGTVVARGAAFGRGATEGENVQAAPRMTCRRDAFVDKAGSDTPSPRRGT